MPHRDNDLPGSQAPDYTDRGFEHIVDIFRYGLDNWQAGLIDRQQDFAINGITARQKELVRERVGDEHAEAIIEELPRSAMTNLLHRATEEYRSLKSAGIDRRLPVKSAGIDSGLPKFDTYLELAGDIDRLGDYIAWLDHLSVSGLGRYIEWRYEVGRGDDGLEELTYGERVKGLSLELGGCFELGDLSHQHGVNLVKERLMPALISAGLEYRQPEHDDRFRVSHHRLKHPSNSERLHVATVTIESPVVDGYREGDGVVHVAQRSEKLVVYPNIPEDVSKMLDALTPRFPRDRDVRYWSQEEKKIAKEQVERMNRQFGRYALLAIDSPAIVPVSTVVYARSVHGRKSKQEA